MRYPWHATYHFWIDPLQLGVVLVIILFNILLQWNCIWAYSLCWQWFPLLRLKQICSFYFQSEVKFDRRKHGILPELPPPEERAQVQSEYMKKFNIRWHLQNFFISYVDMLVKYLYKININNRMRVLFYLILLEAVPQR